MIAVCRACQSEVGQPNAVEEPTLSEWKNWGDHPLFVGVTLLASVLAILTSVLAIYELFEQRRSRQRSRRTATGKPNYSRATIFFAAVAVVVAVVGWGAFIASRMAPPAMPSPATPPTPTAGPMTGITFQPFGGTSFAPVSLTSTANELVITPPAGYARLWGVYQLGTRCISEVEFAARIEGDTSSAGFGYAVAPRSTIVDDQPSGWSIQYEWDGDKQGYFVRPVILPSQARIAGNAIVPAPDVRQWHHMKVIARGTENEVLIDGTSFGRYTSPSPECGGLALRVWGGTVHIRNLTVLHR